jgi:hypothetical protein
MLFLAGSALAAAAAITFPAPSAHACGGCFGPPPTATESIVVTGHRMAVAISPTETTLWDQFQYAGRPEDFAWILPIDGTATVELADNAFFEALAQQTQVNLVGTYPPLRTFCSDPCPSDLDLTLSGSESRGGIALDGGAGVTVFHEGVVGPYETATIGSEDPDALVDWLQAAGYAIPDETRPVIAHYVELGLNFAALRLTPNAGVNQMQPVRVTTPGLMPVFPLRMVSVGAADTVGLTLYVFAEGRYGSQNFPTVELDRAALRYDWASGTFNYGDLFDATLAEHDGRAWIVESAGEARLPLLRAYSSMDEDGTVHTPDADLDVVMRGLSGAPYLTVLRTDMPVAHLDQDLILEAADTVDVASRIEVPRDVNRPPEPDCPTSCDDPTRGTAATGTAGGPGGGVGGDLPDGLCSSSAASRGSLALLGMLGLAAGGLALRRRRC